MTDQTWPYPYKPFPEPVPPVPVGSAGVTCWQFDAKWTPYILATLKTLAVSRTWESEADRAVAEARDLMGSLIESTYDCDGGEDCIDFSPRAGFIDWFPSNPFDPDAPLPDGYTTLPWVVVEDPNIFDELLSLQVGDVLALTYAPAGEKQNFVIHVNGPGTVEIHLIQKLLGGAAFIVADDNPFVAPSDVIELNRDIVSVPPELTTIFVKECTFTTAGPHTIRVSFGPRLDDSATLLGFGGGLRKIVLCGFDTEGLEMDVRQKPGLPCKLEKSFNGTTWIEFADLQNCPPKIRTDRGKTQWWDGTAWVDLDAPDERLEGEADPPYPEGEVPSGQTGNCLAAENITAFYSSALTQIRQMLGAGIVFSAIAGPLSVTMAVFMSAPVVLPAAVIIASFAALLGTIGLDDMLAGDLLEKVKCAIACNINPDGSVTASQYTALYDQIGNDLSGTQELLTKAWLDGFGPVGLTRQGRAAGITTGDCDDCGCGWIFRALGGHGNGDKLTLFDGQGGFTYVPTYNSVDDVIEAGFCAANSAYFISMAVEFGGAIVDRINIVVSKDAAAGGGFKMNGNIGDNSSFDQGLGEVESASFDVSPHTSLTNVVVVIAGFVAGDRVILVEIFGHGTPPAGLF